MKILSEVNYSIQYSCTNGLSSLVLTVPANPILPVDQAHSSFGSIRVLQREIAKKTSKHLKRRILQTFEQTMV